MSVCKNCNKDFNEWSCVANCDNCDDGYMESTRDFGWDRNGYMKCFKCDGAGEIKTVRNDFCSEECIDEHFENKD